MSIPLDRLFPPPSLPTSRISPVTLPGTAHESLIALQGVLKENHEKWHIFFNDRGFHNHIAHRALAVWSLGGAGAVIKAGYEKDSEYQRPAFKSPGEITHENFNEHLGDEKYYDAYLHFFTDIVLKGDISESLEKYIFSKKVNIERGKEEEKNPQMLNRFFSGLMHPMIHTGYGCEFTLPGMLIEGLAQTAVHKIGVGSLIPTSAFEQHLSGIVEEVSSRLTSMFSMTAISPTATVPVGTHAFSILARVLKDSRFDHIKKYDRAFDETVEKHGDALRDYANQWSLNTSNPQAVEERIEELIWANVMIYGIAGWSDSKSESEQFNADFFLMHLVTSSLFLSSITAYLSPSSQSLLLRSYFTVSLAWWVSRGRPSLSIDSFFSKTDRYPFPPGPLPKPDKSVLPGPDSNEGVIPNPWLPIIQTTVVHPDEHLPKLQRALAHYARLYGERSPGSPDFEDTELEGADKLDGSLFLRVAGLTARRMGRVRDGEKPGEFWDREGFYEE